MQENPVDGGEILVLVALGPQRQADRFRVPIKWNFPVPRMTTLTQWKKPNLYRSNVKGERMRSEGHPSRYMDQTGTTTWDAVLQY